MNRIYHHWESWECYKAGFYGSQLPIGVNSEQAKIMYAEFLSNIPRFNNAMDRVLIEWPNSCDQFLSNESINRIAWLGQSSMCIETGIPSMYRAGFKLLTIQQQRNANFAAEFYLKKWLRSKGNEKSHGIHQKMGELWLS